MLTIYLPFWGLHNRIAMKYLLFVVSLLFIPISQAAISKSISVEKLSDNAHLLKGIEYSTSIGVVLTDDGLILIDPMPGETQLNELQRVISALYDQPVRYILNTHAHEDHSGGNKFFDAQGNKFINSAIAVKGIKQIVVNSHTAKDNIYYLEKSNSIFVGDVFDSSWHPTFYSGGIKGFEAAIAGILALGNEESLIIPGHGQPASKAVLRDFRNNTLTWTNNVSKLHLKGLSIEEIMNNPKTIEILARFNGDNKQPFLPEKAFEKFVERTISLVSKDKAN